MLLGGPHPLQSKVPLKDTCTNNKGPKQFSRVSNTCSISKFIIQTKLCVVFIISLKFNFVFINTVVVWFNLFRAMLASSHRESLFPTN